MFIWFGFSGDFKSAIPYCQQSCETVGVVYGSNSVEVADEKVKLSQLLFHTMLWVNSITQTTKQQMNISIVVFLSMMMMIPRTCARGKVIDLSIMISQVTVKRDESSFLISCLMIKFMKARNHALMLIGHAYQPRTYSSNHMVMH